MVSGEIFDQIAYLTLITFDDFKMHKIKRNFIFEHEKIYVVVNRNSQTVKNIRKGSGVQILIGNQKLNCAVELTNNFQKIFNYLKKEMKKLVKFYGNKYERTEAHLRISATNHILLELKIQNILKEK